MNKIMGIISRVLHAITVVIITVAITIGLTQYTNYATVTNVQGSLVEIEDWDGHIWAFDGDGYTQGQLLYVRFNNMGTKDYKSDDIIVDVQTILQSNNNTIIIQ